MGKNFWKFKKVIVTGSTGFVGAHLVSFLKDQGADIIGLSRKDKQHSGDVSKMESIRKYFSNVFAVFHLASDALVETGQEKPYQTLKNTILGALNILELSRIHKVQKIIIASTSQVYGSSDEKFSESDNPKPTRPYETSKTCVDIIAQSYADSFGLPVLIPRFTNIYGPGDLHFDRLIPKTIKSILDHKNPTMWGGYAKRSYLYIDDAVRAYDTLGRLSLNEMEKNRIYNFASNSVYTVEQIIEKIIARMHLPVSIVKIDDARKGEAVTQILNTDKSKRMLDWRETVSLDVGLAKTIDWYKNTIG
jgi:CDP-glucose 4,6-dehydratase